MGRRQQRPGRRARRRGRLRAQRRHQHQAAQGWHRGHHHRRQRAGPRPRRPSLHELPARARCHLTEEHHDEGSPAHRRPVARRPEAPARIAAASCATTPITTPRCCGATPSSLYFAKPSTRTRLSFGSAVTPPRRRPRGRRIVNELQLGRGETIEDTARVVSRYARAFVIRTFADDDVAGFAAAATIPVINALTDGHHPCQALADLADPAAATSGTSQGCALAYLGDGNNVAHSLLEACALAGVEITVASPPGYEPDPDVVATAAASGYGDPGRRSRSTHDPRLAVSRGRRRLHRRLGVDG